MPNAHTVCHNIAASLCTALHYSTCLASFPLLADMSGC